MIIWYDNAKRLQFVFLARVGATMKVKNTFAKKTVKSTELQRLLTVRQEQVRNIRSGYKNETVMDRDQVSTWFRHRRLAVLLIATQSWISYLWII